jgi:hypothetical protein
MNVAFNFWGLSEAASPYLRETEYTILFHIAATLIPSCIIKYIFLFLFETFLMNFVSPVNTISNLSSFESGVILCPINQT